MRPVWQLAVGGGSWWDQLSAPRTLGLMLWIGLALITLSLLILMRTRWGQTKPLSKCIVLSLFAHILFLGYASGTRLVFDCPRVPREEVLKLSLLVPGDEPLPDPPETSETWKEPWAASSEDMPVPSPIRQAPDPLAWDPSTEAEAPEVSVQPDAHAPSESEPVRETAPLPKPLLPKAPQPAPSELAMRG